MRPQKSFEEGGGCGVQETKLLELYDQYSGMIYRISVSYLRQIEDAEDAVQAVFMKLIEGKAQPEIGKERAFLTSITINYCKDVLRSVWKRRVVPLDDAIVFEQEEDRELFHAVMKLPDKLRIVVHLHYYEGYNFSEIAMFLKISSSAVSMRLHRARKKLKDKLREEYGYGEQLQTDI
jgi:RNA polymerase sigma-70 factor (ECF subfamily)